MVRKKEKKVEPAANGKRKAEDDTDGGAKKAKTDAEA